MGSPASSPAPSHANSPANLIQPTGPGIAPVEGLTLRPGVPDDARMCGRICHDAFRDIASRHGFPPDFPNEESSVELFRVMLSEPDVHVVVAELDGRIVGSNALWEQTPIAGVGPITVEPAIQNGAVGRALMLHVLNRADDRRHTGVRLVQAAYHNRSLALYTRLGFDPREPLSVFQGPPIRAEQPDRQVRDATPGDIEACGRLHQALHGYSRIGELPSAIAGGTARVVLHRGRISGYATQIGFFGHAVGRSNGDLMALIGAAPAYAGPGFFVPTRNVDLMRWCLEHGLRIVQPMTLMSRGFFRQPKGAYLPSVLF